MSYNTVVGTREAPWSGITQEVEALDAQTAIRQGGLDWQVEMQPVYRLKGGKHVEVPGRFVTVRTDTEDVLGVVGSHYVPFQHEEAFDWTDQIPGYRYTSAGTARGGKLVFLTMQRAETLTILDDEEHDVFLLVRTSHDGSKAINVYVLPFRRRCANTAGSSIFGREALQSWSIQHVSTAAAKLEEALETFRNADTYLTEYQSFAEQLASTEVELESFQRLLRDTLPVRPKTGEVIGDITRLFESSPTIPDRFRGTAWGAYNAVTEYLDHGRNQRSAEARFIGAVDGYGASIRNRVARKLVTR